MHERAEVLGALVVDLREQRRELWVAPGGGRQDLDERADALEPDADVGGEQPQLLALVDGRGDGAGPVCSGTGDDSPPRTAARMSSPSSVRLLRKPA